MAGKQRTKTHHFKEEVHVRPLVYKEPDRMPVDGDLEYKVWRRARLHRLTEDAVVVRVDQGLVEVEDEHLATNKT
jgi:hypothetical protein